MCALPPWERKVFSGDALIREQIRLYDAVAHERAEAARERSKRKA